MSAVEGATFAARWRAAVEHVTDRPFLTFEDADGRVTAWTYGEFDQLVSSVAADLASRGVGPGTSVHLALANSPAFVAVWLAVTQLGAWIVPSDPAATAPELAEHIKRTAPVIGVCAAARAATYGEGASGGPEIVAVDEADPEVGGLRASSTTWSPERPAPHHRASVMFTSGTTSAPKGVVVTQANYAFAGDVMAAAAGLSSVDRLLVVLPLFHANAQYYSFAAAISVGASVSLIHAFSASGFLAQAARHDATHASLFAAPMRMILARGATPVEGVRLRHCWYAQNITAEQYDEVSRLFGCRPRQLYGMTETIPAVLTNRAVDPIHDSMGLPTLGCQVDLRRQGSDEPVADGDVGEIVVRGDRGVTLFAEYLDDPTTTSSSFLAGWLRTGDLAVRDSDGRFVFAGRRSDVLKVAGENVSVVEVEAVLAEHPSVLEAAVVGEPDDIRDEVPVGFVVQQPGRPPLIEAELLAWCAERLSKAKRPHRVEIVDELPRTSVGKIRKFLLKHRGTEVGERRRTVDSSTAEPASPEASAGGQYAERAQT